MAMEQAAPQGQSSGSPQDSLKGLITNIANGLSVLGDVASEAGMGDGFLQLGEQFKSLVEQMMAGGSQAPQGVPGQGAPEAGAAKAVPAGMQMR